MIFKSPHKCFIDDTRNVVFTFLLYSHVFSIQTPVHYINNGIGQCTVLLNDHSFNTDVYSV